MNAVAPWVWKEWRAQRSFLAGYVALTFASLTIFFMLRHLRGSLLDQNPAQVVQAFVMAALAGLVITASQIVQQEHVDCSDQLLRRLPGALAPAFAGKLGFLLLAMMTLLLLAVAAGEGLLLATGSGLVALSELGPPDVGFGIGDVSWFGALAMLWVFAVAFWMPQGRMAVGAVALFGLALVLATENVLMTCSGLNRTIDWRPWLCYLLPLGLAVGYAGCVRGRRGGDHRRSAKLGAASLIVGLLPPAGWLGAEVWEFHRPDLTRMVDLDVLGTTPDGRFAIAHGAREYEWSRVPFRIDLTTGDASQIAAPGTWIRRSADLSLPGPVGQRFWPLQTGRQHLLYDSATSATHDRGTGEERTTPAMPAELCQAFAAERAATAPFRQPGNLPAWIDGRVLHLQQADGSVQDCALPWRYRWLTPAGHGMVDWSDKRRLGFDLKLRRLVKLPVRSGPAFAIDGVWLLAVEASSSREQWVWRRFDAATGEVAPCTDLARDESWIGILDEGEVLFSSSARQQLFVYRPAARTAQALVLPSHPFLQASQWYESTSGNGDRRPYGLRDPRGRLWVRLSRRGDTAVLFVAVDPASRTCTVVAESTRSFDVVCFPDDHSVLGVEDHRRLVRIDLPTGERTVRFPPAR